MGVFQKLIYSIVKGQDCLPMDKCPAVQAEMEEKTADEICNICKQCWDKMQTTAKQKSR